MRKDLRRLAALAPGRSRMLTMLMAAGLGAVIGHAQVVNGDFSSPRVTGPGQMVSPADAKPWKTTDSKQQIEIWLAGSTDPTYKVKFDAPPNTAIKQFAEVNANSHGVLSQEVNIKDGSPYGFSFWHRGRHSATEGDTIEVTVKDGTLPEWKRTFSTNNSAWKQYTVDVATKKGTGPVTLSFRSVSTSSKNNAIGNFLTGIQLDSTVKPPSCAINVPGAYKWTTDNRQTTKGNGKLENVGIANLTADRKASNNARKGVWQISNDCEVTINWDNETYIDKLKLSPDGKQLSGKNQIDTIITGTK